MNKKHQMFSCTQPNPLQNEKFGLKPNPTHGLTQPMSISDVYTLYVSHGIDY